MNKIIELFINLLLRAC